MSEENVAGKVKGEELSVENLVKVLREISTKLGAVAGELKTKNELDKERLDFTRAKDAILAELSKSLKDKKKKKESQRKGVNGE